MRDHDIFSSHRGGRSGPAIQTSYRRPAASRHANQNAPAAQRNVCPRDPEPAARLAPPERLSAAGALATEEKDRRAERRGRRRTSTSTSSVLLFLSSVVFAPASQKAEDRAVPSWLTSLHASIERLGQKARTRAPKLRSLPQLNPSDLAHNPPPRSACSLAANRGTAQGDCLGPVPRHRWHF
ncbi:hypothetical protein VTN00DRAFT_6793 [Thermoascus crustaceus]|uniref:uncharacterized protein n=1 Tax=Thermoascus crustaceus TaxID=5088 RepID=UPI003744163B